MDSRSCATDAALESMERLRVSQLLIQHYLNELQMTLRRVPGKAHPRRHNENCRDHAD